MSEGLGSVWEVREYPTNAAPGRPEPRPRRPDARGDVSVHVAMDSPPLGVPSDAAAPLSINSARGGGGSPSQPLGAGGGNGNGPIASMTMTAASSTRGRGRERRKRRNA